MNDAPVRARIVVPSPLKEVRAAFTDPNTMTAWWSAWAGCAITSAAIDATPGGSFRVESRTKKNTQHYVTGRFLHVSDDLLAFTWETETSTNFASTVFLRFARGTARGTTAVEVEHRDLFVEEERLRCDKAWRQILAVLQRGLPRLRADRPAPDVQAYLSDHAR